MAYGDFSLESVTASFGLTITEHADLFVGTAPVAPSDWLKTYLAGSVPLGCAINTEKARSEMMIAPVLAEVRIRYADQCSIFSGTELNVAPEKGLRGYCDFIVSRSPLQHVFSAPLVVIAEAKNLDIAAGYGQCIAGMLGAQLFNQSKGISHPAIYGAISTGEVWVFLKLSGTTLVLDMQVYSIDKVERILGVLVKLVTE